MSKRDDYFKKLTEQPGPPIGDDFWKAGRFFNSGKKESDMDKTELAMGIEVEYEHTTNRAIAKRIALDHLAECSSYYTRLKKMEKECEGK